MKFSWWKFLTTVGVGPHKKCAEWFLRHCVVDSGSVCVDEIHAEVLKALDSVAPPW